MQKNSYNRSVWNEVGVQQWILNRTCLSLPVLCVTCLEFPAHHSIIHFDSSVYPTLSTWPENVDMFQMKQKVN